MSVTVWIRVDLFCRSKPLAQLRSCAIRLERLGYVLISSRESNPQRSSWIHPPHMRSPHCAVTVRSTSLNWHCAPNLKAFALSIQFRIVRATCSEDKAIIFNCISIMIVNEPIVVSVLLCDQSYSSANISRSFFSMIYCQHVNKSFDIVV